MHGLKVEFQAVKPVIEIMELPQGGFVVSDARPRRHGFPDHHLAAFSGLPDALEFVRSRFQSPPKTQGE